MCGILWAQMKDGGKVNKSILKRYTNQKSRGTQGFAFLGLKDGVTSKIERAMYETDILKKLRDDLSSGILFHHRLPTSTVNIPEATHPIVVENENLDYNYYLVHNGVISNDDELKKKHEKLGFKYTTIINNVTVCESNGKTYRMGEKETFNDSEALAIEVARFIDGDSDVIDTRGSASFICLQTDKKGKALKLYFGHNEGNPLVMEETKGFICLKSEGHGEKLPADKLFYYNFDDEKRQVYESYVKIGNYFGANKHGAWQQHQARGHAQPYKTNRDHQYEDNDDLYSVRKENSVVEDLKMKGLNLHRDGVWRYTTQATQDAKEKNNPTLPFAELEERRKMELATGDDTDYNGWDIIDLYEEIYALESQMEGLRDGIVKNVAVDADNYLNQYWLKEATDEHKKISDVIYAREAKIAYANS